MAMTLKGFVAQHPVDRERVKAHKERMLTEARAYRLRGPGQRRGDLLDVGLGQRDRPGPSGLGESQCRALVRRTPCAAAGQLAAAATERGQPAAQQQWSGSRCDAPSGRCARTPPTSQTCRPRPWLACANKAAPGGHTRYQLKEALRAIFADDLDPKTVMDLLTRWCSWAQRSRLPSFVKAARTIRRHVDGIGAAVTSGLANGRQRA